MDKRKEKREARLKREMEDYKASNPTINEQFADLKRKLHTMLASEWESIPEIGGHSCRNKKRRRFESYVPVLDTLLDKARQEKEKHIMTAFDPEESNAGVKMT